MPCSLSIPPLVIAAELVLLTGFIVLNMFFTKYLHDTLPSKIRVGATSVVTTLGYSIFLPVAFVFGELSNRLSVFRAAWIVVALAAAILLCAAVAMKRRNSLVATERAELHEIQ